MFSRSTVYSLVAVALSLSGVARAEIKLGYVDLQRALQEVDEGRQAKVRLQALLDSNQKDIDKRQEALKKESDTLQKQSSAMSEETLRQKQIDLQKKLMELAQDWEKRKQEMATKERNELQAIFAKMDPLIAQIAQREGLTMVFEKTDSGLVYAPASLDITNELVRTYNGQKSGGAKKAPDAPKSDAPKK